MTGAQLDFTLMLAFGALASLIGFGVIKLGADTSRSRAALRVMRVAGPGAMICAVLLLASTFVR